MLPRGSYAGLKVEHMKLVFFHHVPTTRGRCAGRGNAFVVSTASALPLPLSTSSPHLPDSIIAVLHHHVVVQGNVPKHGVHVYYSYLTFPNPHYPAPPFYFGNSPGRQGRAPLPAYSRGATRPRNDGTQLSRARCMSVLIAPIAIRVRPRRGS